MNGRVVFAGIVFAATWMVWSGMMKPLLLGLGVLSVLLVLGLALRIGFFESSMHTLHLLGRLPRFWSHLLPEIVKTNLTVTRIVLSRRLPVSPCITRIDVSRLPRTSQVVLANAITRTPGTMTLDVSGGQIEVHCLTRAAARDLNTSGLIEQAGKLQEA